MKPTERLRSNICCFAPGADCRVQACNLQMGPGTAARFHGNLSSPLLLWPLVVWRRASFVLAPFHCGRGDVRVNIPPTNVVTCGLRTTSEGGPTIRSINGSRRRVHTLTRMTPSSLNHRWTSPRAGVNLHFSLACSPAES